MLLNVNVHLTAKAFFIALALFCTLSSSRSSAQAQSPGIPYLVRDIYPGPAPTSPSSAPSNLTALGNVLFFSVTDINHGRELWVGDNTASGVRLVKDINPGFASSNPQYFTFVGPTVYFSADDGVHGTELWKSDGTTSGTVMVADIRPGSTSSTPQPLAVMNGRLYFTAYSNASGMELWKTDGTEAGTVMVKDIYPGNSSSYPKNMIVIGNTLFFSATDTNGTELWKSDGTTAGTVMVKDIYPYGSSSPQEMIEYQGVLFFQATTINYHSELWRSDGTAAGTFMVKDINPGPYEGYPQHFVVMNGKLYFSALTESTGQELWCSDGTDAGTTMVKDIVSGPAGSRPTELTVMNGMLYFFANGGLWRSDGTASGTIRIGSSGNEMTVFNGALYIAGSGLYRYDGTNLTTVLAVNASGTDLTPKSLTDVRGTLYFTAETGITGRELWLSDGTARGTMAIKDISFNPGQSNPDNLTTLSDRYGTLLFTATDEDHGLELWRSDGTTSGTQCVLDINPGPAAATPRDLLTCGSRVFFSANDGIHGRELWLSDGTASGTILLKDINPGGNDSHINSMAVYNGRLFFLATDAANGQGLWTSDGTPAGTLLLKAIDPNNTGAATTPMVWVNSRLFFIADDGVHGRELWSSNGTLAGTRLVMDIAPGASSSSIKELTPIDATLYLTADDGIHGRQVWKSDGTAAGTVMVKDLNPTLMPTGGASPQNLIAAGGILYFKSSPNGGQPTEVWMSDGTNYGTLRIYRMSAPHTQAYGPIYLAPMGNSIYFLSSYNTVNYPYSTHAIVELWTCDGTMDGIVQLDTFDDSGSNDLAVDPQFLSVIDGLLFFNVPFPISSQAKSWGNNGTVHGSLALGPPLSNICNILDMGDGTAFFSASDGSTIYNHGQELWRTDGTIAGTSLLQDIAKGAANSYPQYLVNFFGTCYFAATANVAPPLSPELMYTNGITAGPTAVTANGMAKCNPQNLTIAGHHLFFAASPFSADTGNELYAIPLNDPLSAAPAALRFTHDTAFAVDVERGGKATTQTLTIRNDGDYAVDFIGSGATPGIQLTGRCAKDFQITQVSPSSILPLAPGQTMTVTIKFIPTEKNRTLGLDAALVISSNSALTPQLTIPIQGDAVPVELASFGVE